MAVAIPAASMMEVGLGSNAMRHSWRHHGRLKPLERFPGLEPVLGGDLAPRRAQDEGPERTRDNRIHQDCELGDLGLNRAEGAIGHHPVSVFIKPSHKAEGR